MDHSPGFLQMVDKARPGVPEIPVEQARKMLAENGYVILLDVREDSEWQKGHAREAVHLGKGVLERDIENLLPDKSREIIMYCGGGYRSIMTAAVAREMGYQNVYSLAGGYKALVQSQWPMSTQPAEA